MENALPANDDKDSPGTATRSPLRRSGAISRPHRVGATHRTDKTLDDGPRVRTQSIVLVDESFTRASAIARYAEQHGVPLQVFWSEDELEMLVDAATIGALIVSDGMLMSLTRTRSVHLRQAISSVSLLILGESSKPGLEQGSNVTGRVVMRFASDEGPGRIVEAAMRAYSTAPKRQVLGHNVVDDHELTPSGAQTARSELSGN